MNRREFIRGLFSIGITVAAAPIIPKNIISNNLSILDAINATTIKIISPRAIADIMFRSSPFLAYLRANNINYDGGIEIKNPFFYEDSNNA